MTKIFESITEWQAYRSSDFFINKSTGFVPTMGNLHAGHQSLLMRSKQECDITILSIFINPTQFSNQTDLNNYPKTISADIDMAKELGIDAILIPYSEEIYPDQYHYRITETKLSKLLCGKHRPGHFDGVLTVVLKLLLLVKANNTYFGEKDYQQLQLIKGLVEAFFIDTHIIACPTIRNEQGLALSSRNNLLNLEQLQIAQQFPKLLSSDLTKNEIINKLAELGFTVDYIEEYFGRRFGAATIGEVRLIDNISIK